VLDGDVRGAVNGPAHRAHVREEQLVQVTPGAMLAPRGSALVFGELPGRVERRAADFA